MPENPVTEADRLRLRQNRAVENVGVSSEISIFGFASRVEYTPSHIFGENGGSFCMSELSTRCLARPSHSSLVSVRWYSRTRRSSIRESSIRLYVVAKTRPHSGEVVPAPGTIGRRALAAAAPWM